MAGGGGGAVMYHFKAGEQFVWEEQVWEVLPAAESDKVLLVSHPLNKKLLVDRWTLVSALFTERLSFIRQTEDVEKRQISAQEYPSLADCSEEQRLTALFRHWVIAPLHVLSNRDRSREVVQKRLEEVTKIIEANQVPISDLYHNGQPRVQLKVSLRSTYRWLKAYDDDIRCLIPQWPGRGRELGLAKEVEELILTVVNELWFRAEKCTVDDIWSEVLLRVKEMNQAKDAENQVEAPTRSTLHRRIIKVEQEYELGRKKPNNTKQVSQMPSPERPLLRVEIDHTVVDLILVDEADGLPLGRPTLTSVLDIATRYPLGYYLGFEPPSYLAVCEALAHAFKPKGDVQQLYGTAHPWQAYGLPWELVVDNGKDFKSRHLEDACLSLGIQLTYAPKEAPEFKGSIERFFRTQNEGLFHKLSGTTFSNIFERGGYDSLTAAKLTLQDLDRALHIFLLDIYAQQFHHGLQGIPAKRWEMFLADGFQPRLPANVKDIDILLGRVVERVPQHYGLTIYGINYNHEALGRLRYLLGKGEKVRVKFHPADLSKVHIYDPTKNDYITVPAVDEAYTAGLSLWKHRLIQQYLKKEKGRVDREGLAWAKRQLRELMSEAKEKTGKTMSRKKVARWETNGQSAQKLLLQDVAQTSVVDTTNQDIQAQLAQMPDVDLTFTAEELAAKGWGLTQQQTWRETR